MDASIIVCTYNRAESLKDTLATLARLEAPPTRTWEVIVVDNNSCDHTRRVVEAAQQTWPRLRYVFEPAQGLSHARNRGIAEAAGEVILFTDDDVLPEPDWMETTLVGLGKYAADACGGYIAPIWETPPPDWLTERFYGFLVVRTDRTDDKVGLFDTSRGHKGKVLVSGEDSEMFERILAAGLNVAFLGSSRVHHKVESFCLTKRYFRRWRIQTSRNLAISRGVPSARRICNVPLFLFLFPQFFRARARALAGMITQPPDEAFNRVMIVCHFLGTFAGLWQARQAERSV